jgi:hypothetical protein
VSSAAVCIAFDIGRIARAEWTIGRGASRLRYLGVVPRKVWTAAEIAELTPSEQDDLFNSSVVNDLREVPDDYLEQVRARLAERTSGMDSPNQR